MLAFCDLSSFLHTTATMHGPRFCLEGSGVTLWTMLAGTTLNEIYMLQRLYDSLPAYNEHQ